MNILDYQKKVKTFKESELLATMNNLQVGAQDLLSNIDALRTNDIQLNAASESWVVSRSVLRSLERAGFRGTSLVDFLQFGLNQIVVLAPEVAKLIKGYHQKLWDGQLMTLRQTNMLNLGEYMNFWLRYATMMLDVLLTMHNEGAVPEKLITKHDARWINGTQDLFQSFTQDLMKGSRVMLQNLARVPDIETSESSLDVLAATEEKKSLDLLQKGFGIHLINPVYWISQGFATLQLHRIERMRQSNQLFAMKISQAINKRNGVDDAALERQIEIYQDAIAKNDWKIADIEADYV